jgi:hypothetical protein
MCAVELPVDDNTPQLGAGSSVTAGSGNAYNVGTFGRMGGCSVDIPSPIFNKNLDCIPERDPDAWQDGVIDDIDYGMVEENYNKRVNQTGYDPNYDIACKDKINVVAISRVGLEYQRGL